MTYEELLNNAPDHQSVAFLDYLKKHNKVIFDNDQWLVIENIKYHNIKGKAWYTAFWKGHDNCKVDLCCSWYQDIDILWYHNDWSQWEWLKKAANKQSINRFHIHIYNP